MEKPALFLEFMDVPIHLVRHIVASYYDCRLFTIAFAIALALKEKQKLVFSY